MKRYYFDVQLTGKGNTPEEAWEDCCEGFSMEPGDVPPVLSTEDEEPPQSLAQRNMVITADDPDFA